MNEVDHAYCQSIDIGRIVRLIDLTREEKAGLAFSFGGKSLVPLCGPFEEEY